MTMIAFFGHDAAGADIRKKVQAFTDDGIEVTGFMMRRSEDVYSEWQNVDLGMTRDGAFIQRIRAIFAGAQKAATERNLLADADVIYARNLDMLACAFLTKRYTKLDTPVIYECLDVHRLLCRSDLIGWAVRALERALLKRCSLLVVSSSAFLKNHFDRWYKGLYSAFLLENRLIAGAKYGPRPDVRNKMDGEPFRLGWFGVLRCQRTHKLMLDLAERFGDQIEIVINGRPSLSEIPDFEVGLANFSNIKFGGVYRAPEDLAKIYGEVDLIWAGDFMEAGFNSVWLLPNRLYEGGYYLVPPIAPAGTETAAWSKAHDSGFSIEEPLEDTFPELIEALLSNPEPIADKQAVLLALDDNVFIQPVGEMRRIIDQVTGEAE